MLLDGICGGHGLVCMASAINGSSLEAVILDTQLIQARTGEFCGGTRRPAEHCHNSLLRTKTRLVDYNITSACFFFFLQWDFKEREEPRSGDLFYHFAKSHTVSTFGSSLVSDQFCLPAD